MREFAVRIEERGETLVVVLQGDAGMVEADRLNLELTRVLALRPPRTVIDLAGVTMLASISMGALLAFKGGVKVQGGTVILAAATGNVLDSLRRACIDKVIPMAQTVEQAIG